MNLVVLAELVRVKGELVRVSPSRPCSSPSQQSRKDIVSMVVSGPCQKLALSSAPPCYTFQTPSVLRRVLNSRSMWTDNRTHKEKPLSSTTNCWTCITWKWHLSFHDVVIVLVVVVVLDDGVVVHAAHVPRVRATFQTNISSLSLFLSLSYVKLELLTRPQNGVAFPLSKTNLTSLKSGLVTVELTSWNPGSANQVLVWVALPHMNRQLCLAFFSQRAFGKCSPSVLRSRDSTILLNQKKALLIKGKKCCCILSTRWWANQLII